MKRERGNILFLILLAIILFVALNYAVNSSLRGGGKDGGSENAQSRAATVMQWFASLEAGVNRMRLTGDVKDNQLNFFYKVGNYATSGSLDNTNCTNANCRVYDPAGGAIPLLDKAVYKKAGGASDSPHIFYRSLANLGSDESEVMVVLQAVDWDICQAINAANGVTSMPYGLGDPGGGSDGSRPYVTGSFPVGAIPNNGLWSAPASVTQQKTFCYCNLGDEASCKAHAFNPRILHVLVTR